MAREDKDDSKMEREFMGTPAVSFGTVSWEVKKNPAFPILAEHMALQSAEVFVPAAEQ
jgi:hypothetical protein